MQHCVCVCVSSSAWHSLARKAQGHAAWLLAGCTHGHLGRMLPPPLPLRRLCRHQQLTSRVGRVELGGCKEEKLCLNNSPQGKLPHRHLLKRARDPILGIPQIRRGASAWWAPTSSLPCMQLSRAQRSLSILPGTWFISANAPQPLCRTQRGDPGAGTALHPPPPGTNACAVLHSHHPEEPTCTGVSEEQLHPRVNTATLKQPPTAPGGRQLHHVCRRSVTATLRPESARAP